MTQDAAPDAVACAGCGVELAPGMLACPACRKLVHGARLTALAAEAEAAEREGRVTDALSSWRTARELLPSGSAQHGAVGKQILRLSLTLDKPGTSPAGRAKGNVAGGAAGLGAAALFVWKLKFVLLSILGKLKLLAMGISSLPTLLSMLAWVSIDRSRGIPVGVGLVASLYVHEMGHVSAFRFFGIKATAPMFVPGIGAFVRMKQYPIDAREDARTGLAGPVWGCSAALVALFLGLVLKDGRLITVAYLGATWNLLNLVPFWFLDGARGFRALDGRQRGIVLALAALGALVSSQWSGLVVCAVGGLRANRDVPAEGDARAFRTFAVLVVVLTVVARFGDLGALSSEAAG